MPVEQFRVLFVCTGNVCRSALAERVFTARVQTAALGPVDASSAGVRALAGRPMTPRTAQLVREYGGEADGFVARQLSGAELLRADLVLGMTQAHCAQATRMEPSVFARTFALREFARACARAEVSAAPGGSHWSDLLAAAVQQRREGSLLPSHDDDVVDPYRQADEVYVEMASRVIPAIDALVRPGRSR